MNRSVLFDFNGTLYFDHDLNYRAWKEIFDMLVIEKIPFEKEYENYKSAGNFAFIEHMFQLNKRKYDTKDIVYWSNQKEQIYQRIGIEEKRTNLPEGAETFLNYLKSHGIAMNIATCSVRKNVDFYFRYFKLEKWFDREKIVYTGENIDKGQLFQEAATRVQSVLSKSIVFEDSPTAVESVYDAGCRGIFYVNSRNNEYTSDKIIQTIDSYSQLDYDLVNKILGL